MPRWLLKGLSFRAPLVSNLNDDGPATDRFGGLWEVLLAAWHCLRPEGFDKFESRLLLLLLGQQDKAMLCHACSQAMRSSCHLVCL